MAIGITRQIASGTHQQVQIPSGNYPWPTIRILNPNDGVFYVKQNADVTNIGYGSWDYKVPSQSYGLLPGEGQGWQSVGLYYLDQSGSGANGEVSIYLTQQNTSEPVFQSIGRAIVSQTTSMDVVQGSQPANPGAGISRIWSDPSGSLNILMPNGTNKVVLDSTNYGSFSLGGDLIGTIGNATVVLQNTHYIYALNTTGSGQTRVLGRANTNSTYLFTGTDGLLYFYSDNPSNNMGVWNANNSQLSIYGGLTATGSGNFNSGLTVPNGAIVAGPAAFSAAGDIGAARTSTPTTGIIYLGNSGARYLYYDGTNYQLPNGGLITGSITANGPAVINGAFRASYGGYLGQFGAGVSWSSSVLNAWIATSMTVSFTITVGTSGNIVIGWTTAIYATVQGCTMYTAMAVDGAVGLYNMNHESVAGYYQLCAGTQAFTGLGAGAHTATLYMQGNAGTFGISPSAHSIITISESVA